MSEATTEKKKQTYESLTPQHKLIMDTVLSNLEKGTGLWAAGWSMPAAPESAITGNKYHGNNNFYLSLVAMARGYTDNRWMTFDQKKKKGWSFKTDEEGNSLGKGQGVTIEFFEFRDKKTKLPYDKRTCDGMTDEEKDEYWRENVRSVRKYYSVFNGDLIDGIPQKEKREIDPNGIVPRAENIIAYWNENESKILYGGHHAFYRPSTDEIRLPEKQEFYSTQEFYGTALHEIGHSTGHEKRLNRDLSGTFGSANYAEEELRAEIASLFIAQDLEIALSDSHIQNNSAYIKSWHDKIKENPNVLFTAISDADKISKYVMSKEKQEEKQDEKKVEYYSIVKDENAEGETVYQVYTVSDFGQTALAIHCDYFDKEALMKDFEKKQGLPFWKGSEFKEVPFSELEKISLTKAREKEKLEEIAEEKSQVFFPPSEVAARVVMEENKPINMSDRGIESLIKMTDKEVVEKASKTKNADKFIELYNGNSVLGNKGKDERSLMARLAMYCNGDTEQLLRVFKSSGQYRTDRKDSYYEKMAQQSTEFISKVKAANAPKLPYLGETKTAKAGANAKA